MFVQWKRQMKGSRKWLMRWIYTAKISITKNQLFIFANSVLFNAVSHVCFSSAGAKQAGKCQKSFILVRTRLKKLSSSDASTLPPSLSLSLSLYIYIPPLLLLLPFFTAVVAVCMSKSRLRKNIIIRTPGKTADLGPLARPTRLVRFQASGFRTLENLRFFSTFPRNVR
jgi:hypothetical protein